MLIERGHRVRVLVRDREAAAAMLPEEVDLILGDATEPSSLTPATSGCELVFNAMGLPGQWLPDNRLFERLRVARPASFCIVHRFKSESERTR